MKIIHFIPSLDRSAGGTTAYMRLLGEALGQLANVLIVTEQTEYPVDICYCKVHFLSTDWKQPLKMKKEWLSLLKSFCPDLVHVNVIWMPQCAMVQSWTQAKGYKVLLSPHGMLEPYILNRHLLKKKLALWLYQQKAIKRANALHATAASELEQFRKLGYTQPAFVVPNGIEISQVQPKTEWRPVQHILFMSRVHPKKGIELLIEAMTKIQRQDIRVTIAGEGDEDYVKSLKQLTREKQVEQQFDFVGGVYGDAKWKLYKEADLFVLPTYSENFGIVVAEALATGLPVITSKGAPWEELVKFKCGWWIELSVDNMIIAMSEAIRLSSNTLEEMGNRGRRLIEEKYDIKKVAREMYKFYQEII